MKRINSEKYAADIVPIAAAALLLLIPLSVACHSQRKHRDLPAVAVSEESNENSGGG